MQEDLLDALRNICVLVWILSVLPSSLASANYGIERVESELTAYRLQQYDLGGTAYGSRSFRVMYEAVSLNRSALRKCLVASWRDLSPSTLEDSISAAVGAVLVVIPSDFEKLSGSEREAFSKLEQSFTGFRTEQSVYFVPENDVLRDLLREVASTSGKAPTAVQQLYAAVAANNFQIASASTATTNTVTHRHYNVIGRLSGQDRSAPNIMIVAHYDSHAIAPALANGTDSNGSGVAAVLELLAVFSRFYADPTTRPRFGLIFMLTSGGKMNYQGSRHWVEEYVEKQSDERIPFVLCIDSIGRGSVLRVHATRQPVENTVAWSLFERLNAFVPEGRKVELVTKKIHLKAERQRWEHEVFGIRRIQSFTVSHFEDSEDPLRTSLLDTPHQLDANALEQNVRLIAESLLSYLYDVDASSCASAKAGGAACSLLGSDSVRKERLLTWTDAFGSSPRPMAASSTKLVTELRDVVQKYAGRAVLYEIQPYDLQLYGIQEDTLVAHVVKPSLFELLLAAVIGLYLFCMYEIVQRAQFLLEGAVARIRKVAA
ncbi:nicalin [Aphelenchoides avenae]|nr:nicalin [Aphelenchus avenae]